ncbi:MAG: hypothetical protein ACREYE_27375 [Gammaproteobacteria bacterium]
MTALAIFIFFLLYHAQKMPLKLHPDPSEHQPWLTGLDGEIIA